MKNINLTSILTVVFSFVLNTALYSNTQAVEYQSPRTLALGGAGRAAPLLNDAIYLNPAYASFNPIYSLFGGFTSFDHGRNYNASVQDSRTEMFQAGAGFTRREQNAAINIGASKQVVQRLGFGLGTKIIVDDAVSKMTTDFLFSTSFIALRELYASLIVDNLLETNDGKARNLFRTVYLGTKIIPIQMVQIYFDPFYSPSYPYGNKAGFSLGAEISLLADFYLRAGKFVSAEIAHLNTRGDGFGFGIGWIGPRVNFDYALNRVTANDLHTPMNTAHSFAVTVFF